MKIRNGFVSNSSSSSFIIAFDRPTICPTCKQDNYSILNAIRCSDCSDTEILLDNAGDILKSFAERRNNGIKDFDYKFERIAELSVSGKEVMEIEVSNWDEKVLNLLSSGEGIEIIYSDREDLEDY